MIKYLLAFSILVSSIVLTSPSSSAAAPICPGVPYIFTNNIGGVGGSTVDANTTNANNAALVACANALSAYVNTIKTSTTTGNFTGGGTVNVPVTDNTQFPIGSYVYIYDGINSITGQVTGQVGQTQITIGTIAGSGNINSGAKVVPTGSSHIPTFTTSSFTIFPVTSFNDVPVADASAFPVGSYLLASDGTHYVGGLVQTVTPGIGTAATLHIGISVSNFNGATLASGATVTTSGPTGASGGSAGVSSLTAGNGLNVSATTGAVSIKNTGGTIICSSSSCALATNGSNLQMTRAIFHMSLAQSATITCNTSNISRYTNTNTTGTYSLNQQTCSGTLTVPALPAGTIVSSDTCFGTNPSNAWVFLGCAVTLTPTVGGTGTVSVSVRTYDTDALGLFVPGTSVFTIVIF